MIKLIASDIDGTLVADGTHELNPELYEVITALKDPGVQFAAASGRQWASIEELFRPVRERIFYLSDNGAYVGCYGRNLFLQTIDRELALEAAARPAHRRAVREDIRVYPHVRPAQPAVPSARCAGKGQGAQV